MKTSRLLAGVAFAGWLAGCTVMLDRGGDIKAVAARAFNEVISTGEVGRASEFYHASFVNHGRDRGRSLAEDMAALQAWHEAFPDLKIEVKQMVAEGDLVSVLWVAQGTNTAAGAGLPATGKTAQLRGITIWKIVDGKIVEEWSAFDQLSLLQQLGLAPSPDP